MQIVLLSFFTHNSELYLYLDKDNKEVEIRLPIKQPDYDPFVLNYWVMNATLLLYEEAKSHIILTETLPDGKLYKIKL